MIKARTAWVSQALLFIAIVFVSTACAMFGAKDDAAKADTSAKSKQAPPKPKKIKIGANVDDLQLVTGDPGLNQSITAKAAPVEDIVIEKKPALKLPKDPNTFLITVDQKSPQHPFYAQGDKRGFMLNGRPGADVVVKRGGKYTFQVQTGVQHDFYLSSNAVGWGSKAFRHGVKGQFTYDGDVSFAPDQQTPDLLYYACRNHKNMGGRIIVVDEKADVNAAKAKAEKEFQDMVAKNKTKVMEEQNVSPAKAKQKVSYAKMLVQFKGKSLPKDELKSVQDAADVAQQALDAGDIVKAYQLANSVAAHFQAKSEKQGPTKEELEEAKKEFDAILDSIESLMETHKQTYANFKATEGGLNAHMYDEDKVIKLLTEANTLANENKYIEGKRMLAKVEQEIAGALNQMLGSQTLVYELKFETTADEYDYEVKRYHSYAELIPVALDVKKPAPGAVKLMEQFKKKAEFFLDKADESAKAERWDEALVIIKDATKEIRRGLMSLGVMM